MNRYVNCKELDSCISLLKSTNDASEYEHTINKLNKCIVELTEFSIDLEYIGWVVAGSVLVGWIGARISLVILGFILMEPKSSNPKNMMLLQLKQKIRAMKDALINYCFLVIKCQ